MQACGDELEGLLAEDGGEGGLSDIEVLSFMRTLHFLVDVERPQVIVVIIIIIGDLFIDNNN